jgi:hypothetical protein
MDSFNGKQTIGASAERADSALETHFSAERAVAASSTLSDSLETFPMPISNVEKVLSKELLS